MIEPMTTTSAPTVVGLTGYAGAGKDTFAKLLSRCFNQHSTDAVIVSSGDLIRQYVRDHNLGDPGNRPLLQKVAGEVMADRGYDVWLEQAIASAAPTTQVLLYPGLRHPVETDFIHRHRGFTIGIKVPVQVRYSRAQARNRPGDTMSIEQFKANEQVERHGRGQQIEVVMGMLDVKVRNDGTLQQLEAVAEAIATDFPDRLAKTYTASEC
jgi:dephospho-CoA kinase